MVFFDKPDPARRRRNGVKHATIFRPGKKSLSFPIQLCDHSARSRQLGNSSVAYLVGFVLEHRVLETIRAIGVDEVQSSTGHKYLSSVYQIDAGFTRLLWIGKERTVKTFEGFFAMIGPEVSAKIKFAYCLTGRFSSRLRRHQRDFVGDNVEPVEEDFQQLWNYESTAWAAKFLDHWCRQEMRSKSVNWVFASLR